MSISRNTALLQGSPELIASIDLNYIKMVTVNIAVIYLRRNHPVYAVKNF